MDYLKLAMMMAKEAGPESILPELKDRIEQWLLIKNRRTETELVALLVMAMASFVPGDTNDMLELLRKMDIADSVVKRMSGDN